MTQLTKQDGFQAPPPEGRPVARPEELFASLTLSRPVANVAEEKQAAQAAIAREAATEGTE